MKKANPISVFAYLEYRSFLRDFYLYHKNSRAGFSFRTFSKRAGFCSSNIFKLVMDGHRNLSEDSIDKFSQGLGLNKQESEFFKNLVYFNQASNQQQRERFYNRLLKSKKFLFLKPLEKKQYDFFSSWHHAVIREMITSPNFDGTPEWLAERIFPKLSLKVIQDSLSLLLKLGLIQVTSTGKYTQTQSIVTTGVETTEFIMLGYHQSMLRFTCDRLTEIPSEKRDISSLTLGVAKGRLEEIKKKVQEFRREILELVSQDVAEDDVLLLNIQLFPVSKTNLEGE